MRAVVTFLGVVRGAQGRPFAYLEYEVYEPMAAKAFAQIEAELEEHWPGAVLGLRHRVGRLAIGEASVVIAVATAHRAGAFQACRYAIERVKQIAPVWKHEFFEDGDAWVEGALADPADPDARREAPARHARDRAIVRPAQGWKRHRRLGLRPRPGRIGGRCLARRHVAVSGARAVRRIGDQCGQRRFRETDD